MPIPIIRIGGVDLVAALIALGISFCIYFIISITINLEFGYTGVPNFGKVLFVAAGGLIGGSLSYRLAVYVLNLQASDIIGQQFIFSSEINNAIAARPLFAAELFFFTLVIGASVGAALGFLASYPAIKLREDYLGMLLLAAGEFLRVFVQSYYPITGGTEGLLIPDPLAWTVSQASGTRDVLVLGILGLFAAGVFFYSERIARSPLGRTLRAVRDNEISSEALGKDNVAIRRNILILASAMSGIAGALFVLWSHYISPTTFVRTVFTFYPWVIVILGGAANNIGVAVGALSFVGITEAIDQYRTLALASGATIPIDLNAVEPIAIGIVLIVILMWRPRGLIPEKPTLTMSKLDLKKIMDSVNKNIEKKEGAPESSLAKAEVPPIAVDKPSRSFFREANLFLRRWLRRQQR
jgi:branched-chain amino acid transport system permease protein